MREDIAGMRLDQAIAGLAAGISRGEARRLLTRGSVFLAGQRVKVASRIVRLGQRIDLHPSELPPAIAALTESVTIPILLETPSLIVVDKPSGLMSAPTPETDQHDLLRVLSATYTELHLVHRLDKPTSGVMVLARGKAAAAALSEQLRTRVLRRRYLAIVAGTVTADAFEQATPVKGQEALTRFLVVERAPSATLLRADLETGRTHQIRVHATDAGHPVAGDSTYGRPLLRGLSRPPRLALHAAQIWLTDPDTGHALNAEAPFPVALSAYWQTLC